MFVLGKRFLVVSEKKSLWWHARADTSCTGLVSGALLLFDKKDGKVTRLPLLTSSEGNRRMFVDEHLAERCLVCCFLGVLGLRVTAAQTYNGRRSCFLAFWVGCEGCFGFVFPFYFYGCEYQ